MAAILPTAFADPAGVTPEEDNLVEPSEGANAPEEEGYTDPDEVEGFYSENTTLYDLQNEEDVTPEPEPVPPPPDPEAGDPDSEIYGSESFDDENASQLEGEYVLDEIIVKFKSPPDVPGKERQLQREISKMQKIGIVDDNLGIYVIRAEDLQKDPNTLLNRLKNNKYIEYVEPNYILKPDTAPITPNDPNYRSQMLTLTALNAQAGWGILTGDSSVVIAVIDSGVVNHPDLPPLLPGYSAVSSLSPNFSKDHHGTGVAGTIGMVGNNGIGGVGINWNASILPVKIDDANGSISVSNLAKGINWAADNGAQVINLSCGTSTDSITLRNAINYAFEKGCVIVAATGNDGKNSILFPARYANVLAVGATSNGTARISWSNYGPEINVMAISGFNTTSSAGGYLSQSGTSFSAPQVSALASMVWALNPSLTNQQVYRMIEENCNAFSSGHNVQTGYGMINIGRTLEAAQLSATGPGPGGPEPPSEPPIPPENPQITWTPPTINLSGAGEMTLEYGQPYVEPGFHAVDCKNKDLTKDVGVTNTTDIWTPGIYTVTYDVTDSEGMSARAVRTVIVNPKPVVVVPPTAPKITVNGSNPIVLHVNSGTPYTEQRARAVDYDGKDISNLVTVSGSINRNTAGTYTITYSVTSPASGLSSSATRNVRIVAPAEAKEPRVKYGLSGQAKQGGIVTHTGIICQELGFMDLKVTAIDNNMTISVRLVDTATKKAVVTDTFTAAGAKQYRIDASKYELVVGVTKASGNSKYSIELLMPEVSGSIIDPEVPLPIPEPAIAPIGSNPIVLHLGGTPYVEQGARAIDFNNDDLSGRIEIIGEPDTSKAGTYTVQYKVVNDLGFEAVATREVRIIERNEFGEFDEVEVPLEETPAVIRQHIVVKGDSLWKISQKYYGTGTRWQEIYEANRSIIGPNPDFLRIGLVLTVE